MEHQTQRDSLKKKQRNRQAKKRNSRSRTNETQQEHPCSAISVLLSQVLRCAALSIQKRQSKRQTQRLSWGSATKNANNVWTPMNVYMRYTEGDNKTNVTSYFLYTHTSAVAAVPMYVPGNYTSTIEKLSYVRTFCSYLNALDILRPDWCDTAEKKGTRYSFLSFH